jgi:hypothetical protein
VHVLIAVKLSLLVWARKPAMLSERRSRTNHPSLCKTRSSIDHRRLEELHAESGVRFTKSSPQNLQITPNGDNVVSWLFPVILCAASTAKIHGYALIAVYSAEEDFVPLGAIIILIAKLLTCQRLPTDGPGSALLGPLVCEFERSDDPIGVTVRAYLHPVEHHQSRFIFPPAHPKPSSLTNPANLVGESPYIDELFRPE